MEVKGQETEKKAVHQPFLQADILEAGARTRGPVCEGQFQKTGSSTRCSWLGSGPLALVVSVFPPTS